MQIKLNMRYLGLIMILAILSSCGTKKKLTDLQLKYDQLEEEYTNASAQQSQQIIKCEDDLDIEKEKVIRLEDLLRSQENDSRKTITKLEGEIDYLKGTNTNLLTRLEDLSVISQAGAESIKQSLEAINKQNDYIKDLNTTIQRKDSVNLSLVQNLKRSLGDVNDDDVNVEVRKGVVYITLSDKLLYRSGSSAVTSEAKAVLGKIASVVNDHSGLDILIEGHTDTDPISTGCINDNWDLSAKRSISIARILQNDYNVDPARMTAGGRGEYVPKADNSTSEGKKINRRTEIIILPKLDEFFKLMEPAGE